MQHRPGEIDILASRFRPRNGPHSGPYADPSRKRCGLHNPPRRRRDAHGLKARATRSTGTHGGPYAIATRPVRAALCLLPLLAGCGPTGGFLIRPVPPDQTLEERTVERDEGLFLPKIALIDLNGLLINDTQNGLFTEGEHAVSLLTEKLRAAERDGRVKAVVLRINSPGGTVTASHLMHHEVRRFREKTGKPVVAFLMDVAASGGYYVACAADEIIACPTTVTGSIGVIMQMVEISGTLSKIGVTTDAIVSGPRKDSGSPFRKMRPEERESFQKIVDDMYAQFVSVVCAGRPKLTEAQVRELADGRVYYATDALKLGLIDGIGIMEDAVGAARRRAGIDKARVIMYHRPLGWRGSWYARGGLTQGSESPPTVNVINLNWPRGFTEGPMFLYLWSIGNPG